MNKQQKELSDRLSILEKAVNAFELKLLAYEDAKEKMEKVSNIETLVKSEVEKIRTEIASARVNPIDALSRRLASAPEEDPRQKALRLGSKLQMRDPFKLREILVTFTAKDGRSAEHVHQVLDEDLVRLIYNLEDVV